MHLVTEDMPFLSGRPTPGSIGILLIPGRQQTAVDDEVPSLNQAHLEQRGDQGDEDQEVGQQTQLPQPTGILGQTDGPPSTRIVEHIVPQGFDQGIIACQPVGNAFVGQTPSGSDQGGQQHGLVTIGLRGSRPWWLGQGPEAYTLGGLNCPPGQRPAIEHVNQGHRIDPQPLVAARVRQRTQFEWYSPSLRCAFCHQLEYTHQCPPCMR